MKILAIDTASTVCSVSILEDTTLLGDKTINDEKTHSQKLMPLIEQLFNELNLTVNDIDLFGVDIGPGSFTGIRIGMSTIKAFCDIYNKPVCGISSLETLAYSIKPDTEDCLICSMIDAKHDNLYTGFFEYNDNKYIEYQPAKLHSIDNILSDCKSLKKPIIFVGNGSILFKDMIESKLGHQAIFSNRPEHNKASAFNLGIATYFHYKENQFCYSEDLEPMYLKKSAAELQMKEK